MKRIVSVWLPDWPIERLARRTPSAVPEAPFALTEATSRGLLITAVNAAAAREGVRRGLRLADARAALPTLVSRPGEPGRDRAALEKLARWIGRFGPSRNTSGSDGLWIDVTGVAHLFGGEAGLLADLVRRLGGFGLTVRASLAGTFGAAHALARTSPGFTIAAVGGERAALAPLSVAALRLDADTIVLLKRLGLARIGSLYGIPRAALERRFRDTARGRGTIRESAALAGAVLYRLDQALGILDEPLAPLAEAPVLEARHTWSEPLMASSAIEAETIALAGEIAGHLGHRALGARHVRLTLWRADGSLAEITAGFSAPTRDGPHIARLLIQKLETFDAGFGIDVMALAVTRAEDLAAGQHAIGSLEAACDDAAVARLADRLAGKLGEGRVAGIELCQSHIPERAGREIAAEAALKAQHRAVIAVPAGDRPAPAPRPPFLLSPPEPIAVLAEVPEGPPRQFTWRRVIHRVAKAEGPERIAPEWWRGIGKSAEDQAGGQTRDYYRIEDHGGLRFWLFRDGLYGEREGGPAPRWFLHGLFG